MSSISRGKRSSSKLKTMGKEDEFLSRIKKSLYYSKLPMTDRLSLPVTEFAAELFSEVKSGCTLERLDVEEASRISRNACVSPCAFVLALLYLERLKDCNPEYLYKVAPSELFLVSLMIASKFLNDDGEEDEVFNTEWATSGDLSVAHVNKLEKEFLGAIDWKVFVDNEDFWNRLKKLEKNIAAIEGRKRGWYSYWEMSCLMETIRISAIVQTLVSVSSICLAAYTAGVVTLLGSALIASQVPGTSLSTRNTTQTTEIACGLEKSSPNDEIDDFEDQILLPQNYSGSERVFEVSRSQNDSWLWFSTWLEDIASSEGDLKNSDREIEKIEVSSNFVGSFVTNPQVLLQNSNIWSDLVTEINWKETLKEGVHEDKSSWRYYVNLVSKIAG